MDQAVPTELRNASDKKRLEIRKEVPLKLGEFLKQWRFLLKRKGKAWAKGPRAVAELRRKKMFDFFSVKKSQQPIGEQKIFLVEFWKR